MRNNKVLKQGYFLLKQCQGYLDYYTSLGFGSLNSENLPPILKNKTIKKQIAVNKNTETAKKRITLETLYNTVQNCTLCQNNKSKINLETLTKKPKIIFVDDFYHHDEKIQNKKINLLTDIATKGLKLKEDDYHLSYLIKCKANNNFLEEKEGQNCFNYLLEELKFIKAPIIISFGDLTARYLTGKNRPVGLLRHETHYLKNLENSYLRVTYSLIDILNDEEIKKNAWRDLQIIIPYLNSLK